MAKLIGRQVRLEGCTETREILPRDLREPYGDYMLEGASYPIEVEVIGELARVSFIGDCYTETVLGHLV